MKSKDRREQLEKLLDTIVLPDNMELLCHPPGCRVQPCETGFVVYLITKKEHPLTRQLFRSAVWLGKGNENPQSMKDLILSAASKLEELLSMMDRVAGARTASLVKEFSSEDHTFEEFIKFFNRMEGRKVNNGH